MSKLIPSDEEYAFLISSSRPDDWAYWMTYLDTLFLEYEESKEKGEERLKEARAFITEIQTKTNYLWYVPCLPTFTSI